MHNSLHKFYYLHFLTNVLIRHGFRWKSLALLQKLTSLIEWYVRRFFFDWFLNFSSCESVSFLATSKKIQNHSTPYQIAFFNKFFMMFDNDWRCGLRRVCFFLFWNLCNNIRLCLLGRKVIFFLLILIHLNLFHLSFNVLITKSWLTVQPIVYFRYRV